MSQIETTGPKTGSSSNLAITIQPIECRSASTLPYKTFLSDYVARNRPLIIRDAVPQWKALRTWTPEFFKSRFGSKTVDVTYGVSMRLADLIDAVLASTTEKPGPYLHKVIIHQHMPELLADLTPENPYSFPRRYCSPLMPRRFHRPDGYLKLLIGGVGGKFPLMHFDSDNAHAMITEIYGDKEFVLFSPQDTAKVYPFPGSSHTSQIENLEDPDLERFPLLVQATEYRGTIHPGEAIFVPCGWWHSAHVVTTSISVCANMLEGASWDGFIDECCQSQNGVTPAIAAKRLYLQTTGTIMSAAEKLQENHPGAVITRSIAFLAPLSNNEAHNRGIHRSTPS
ncbi:MAG TPA: cupin-like domain-containing protein [Silvibacterium sp.]|nr:cupin-like domain-containing protein [Silvibacterium sp.]